MTLQEFTQLDKSQQQQALKQAAKLAERMQPDFKYELYQLDNFYVEVKLELPNDNLVGLQTFKTQEQVGPYLNLMNTKADGVDE